MCRAAASSFIEGLAEISTTDGTPKRLGKCVSDVQLVFLEFWLDLGTALLAGPLGLVELVFAEVHDAGDLRFCARRDQHQIQSGGLRPGHGGLEADNADLLVVLVDQANLVPTQKTISGSE